jgi:putative DNA primase/helicase
VNRRSNAWAADMAAALSGAAQKPRMAMPLTAETIAKALGGRKAGGGWMACCPAHDDRKPSLSIYDADEGKVLERCHAGCDQQRVIVTLRSRGLWTENFPRRFIRPAPRAATSHPDRDDAKRSKAALAIWQSAISVGGSPVETYLASRRLHLPLPPMLRHHAGMRHPSGAIRPEMVGLVTRGSDDTPLAIHRTFLACNGGAKTPINKQKMMLGPCRGGAVRLGLPGDVLMMSERYWEAPRLLQQGGRP